MFTVKDLSEILNQSDIKTFLSDLKNVINVLRDDINNRNWEGICNKLEEEYREHNYLKLCNDDAARYNRIRSVGFSMIFSMLLENGMKLTDISMLPPQCFSYVDVKRVEIPANIKKIGNFAFEYCTELKEIAFESDDIVFDDAYGAIQGCRKLTSVELNFPVNDNILPRQGFTRDCLYGLIRSVSYQANAKVQCLKGIDKKVKEQMLVDMPDLTIEDK